jgi:glutamine synthetase
MLGHLSFQQLQEAVADGSIDTVAAVLVDMQGRLMGKRFHAQHFVDSAFEETHCCDYLLATDLEMATPDGYKASSWEAGYGDYIMKPDLNTIRVTPWAEGAALVLCDVLDHHTHEPVPHSPRQMLKRQLERLAERGYQCAAATELEFFLFDESYAEARAKGYQNLSVSSAYNEDYHLFQTAKEEHVMRAIRNELFAAGIPVENTKGEAEAGQAELNIRYAEMSVTADMHAIAKHAVKEIAWREGRSVTFLAKTGANTVGSSSHVHLSLRDENNKPVFHDPGASHGMSTPMLHALAGQLAYAADITCFLAPYVNSYKRFAPGTFAPTKAVWSLDNRTSGFRICGADTPAVRIECRIGGVDLNPYLAFSGLVAATIAGLDAGKEPPPACEGDAYAAGAAPEIPRNLRDATEVLRGSNMLREALGDDVVDHYVRCAEVEQEAFDRAVTDYEIRRGFERC